MGSIQNTQTRRMEFLTPQMLRSKVAFRRIGTQTQTVGQPYTLRVCIWYTYAIHTQAHRNIVSMYVQCMALWHCTTHGFRCTRFALHDSAAVHTMLIFISRIVVSIVEQPTCIWCNAFSIIEAIFGTTTIPSIDRRDNWNPLTKVAALAHVPCSAHAKPKPVSCRCPFFFSLCVRFFFFIVGCIFDDAFNASVIASLVNGTEHNVSYSAAAAHRLFQQPLIAVCSGRAYRTGAYFS